MHKQAFGHSSWKLYLQQHSSYTVDSILCTQLSFRPCKSLLKVWYEDLMNKTFTRSFRFTFTTCLGLIRLSSSFPFHQVVTSWQFCSSLYLSVQVKRVQVWWYNGNIDHHLLVQYVLVSSILMDHLRLKHRVLYCQPILAQKGKPGNLHGTQSLSTWASKTPMNNAIPVWLGFLDTI